MRPLVAGRRRVARISVDASRTVRLSQIDRADKVAQETAIDTLLDDVELLLESDDQRMAKVMLTLARSLMVVHGTSDPDLLAWFDQLLERTSEDKSPPMH